MACAGHHHDAAAEAARREQLAHAARLVETRQQPIEVKQGMVMRTAIQENGLEIHKGMKAKMSSCGGAGQCASCWVEVTDGMENLSPPTDAEERMRKKRPESWRMACQALCNGPVSVVVKSLEKPP